MQQDLRAIELSTHKFVNHLDKLNTLARGGDVFPVTVELDLVDYCNHGCWWCVDPVHSVNTLDRGFVSLLLKELRSLGVEGIVYKGGGEPTLHPSFADIVEETKGAGFETGVVTNGSRLLKLYDSIVDSASYLRVSIDGPTPASHKNIHRSNDFEEIINGVRATVNKRDGNKQRHPIIGLSFAMDYSMKALVGDAIALGDNLHVDYILLRPPFFEEVGRKSSMTAEQGNALRAAFEKCRQSYRGDMEILIDYWISDAESEELYSIETSPRRGAFVHPGANGIEHITRTCRASPMLAVVAADKKVYPCCNLRFLEGWSVGTVDYENGSTFKTVWKSRQRKSVLDRIHRTECIASCTHPMSRYNEVIAYLQGPCYHRGFV